MSFNIEDLGKNMVKLTIEATAEEFDKAMDKAYKKNRGSIAIQGFRKGKAPRAIIEKVYGAGIFYEDAANEIIPDAYDAAAKESGLDIVSTPEIDVVKVEKGSEFIFTAVVAVKPVVVLAEYKGLEIEKQPVEVSDEEIEEEIEKAREQNSRVITIEDRAVMNGDTAVIDYEGFIDDVAFEGGKGENHELIIGSHSFIDTFEEQLIGKEIGEDVLVNVTFPEEYHADTLAGKEAVFKVRINEIRYKELPEADDDFAQDVSEYDTLDEYKESIKKSIIEKKEKEAVTAKENALVDKLIESASMDIPKPMIETQKKRLADEFAQRMQMQGLTLEQYFQFTGMNNVTFMNQLESQAIKRIKTRLVLEAVVKAESITATEEELNKELNDIALAYKMEEDKIKELLGESEIESIKMDICVQKAVDLVTSSANEV